MEKMMIYVVIMHIKMLPTTIWILMYLMIQTIYSQVNHRTLVQIF